MIISFRSDVLNRDCIQVLLTPEQIASASEIGRKRNKLQRLAKRKDDIVHGSSSIERDIAGAQAELAASLGLGVQWAGPLLEIEAWDRWKKDGHDLGYQIEVKSTEHANGCLLLQEKHDPNLRYVMVVTRYSPEFLLIGWELGSAIKQQSHWDKEADRPCYKLMQSALRPLSELLAAINKPMPPNPGADLEQVLAICQDFESIN